MPHWSARLVGPTLFLALLAIPLAASSVGMLATDVGGLEGLYPWPESPINLLRNPSFETGDAQGGPLDWVVGDPSHFFRARVPHTGLWSMQLQDSHLAPYTPMATQSLALPPGWYNLRGWARAVSAGTLTEGSGGRISLWGTGASTDVIRGTTGWTTLERPSIAVPPGPSPTLRLEAYEKPDGTIFFDDVELHRLAPPAVEGFVLYPNYRGVLFADRSQQIRVRVTARPEELGLTAAALTVRLSLVTMSGAVVTRRDFPPSAAPATVSLDATAAPLGRYRLRLQALRAADGAVLFEHPAYGIAKLSAADRSTLATYVDPDNVTVLNGQRRFVLGIYDTTAYSDSPSFYEPQISKIAQAPINVYLNYWLGRAPTSALTALTTTLRKYGMSYLHTVNFWYQDDPQWPLLPPCQGQTPQLLGQDGYTACRARELGADPGLAGWYTADERTADQAPRVFGQYKVLRQNDPGGVAFIAQNNVNELSRWRDAVDVMGVDPYPIYGIPEGSPSPLEMVTDWTDRAQQAVERSRPVWAVVQFFQFGSQGHWPTYDELRTMSYMAIVAGAKGLFYWSYGAGALAWVDDPVLREEYWQRLVRVTTEIKSIEPALLSPDAPEVLAAVSPGSGMRVLAKQIDGTRYLVAVNNTAEPNLVATFTLAEDAGNIDVVQEARTLEADGPTFSDIFGPYEVHVYRISAASGGSMAAYDMALKAPKCGTVGSSCDSGALLTGRAGLGPEPNQPNTINLSCADGRSGRFHVDESNDRIKVSTLDGTGLTAGKPVRIEATVWAFAPSQDKLDLYYAANAASPVWTYITTLTPTASGAQTLSATYILPAGSLQAVRARFRYQGAAASCGTGAYEDHDDLVFAVSGGAVFDPTLKAPKCAIVGSSCDSGTLLVGRAGAGPEPNPPNTIKLSCADGTGGAFHADESNDRLKVSTLDGTDLAAGKTVRIEASVWAFATPSKDRLDLYYAAAAASPVWRYIATLTPTVPGAQTLTATYTLPIGSLQAVRARFRYEGIAAACGTGAYDDHDDLIFAAR